MPYDNWTRLRITFWTTTDNKDDSENITVQIEKGPNILSSDGPWGVGQKWDNGHIEGFDINLSAANAIKRADINRYALRILKSIDGGGNGCGWGMCFELSGFNPDNTWTKLIPRTSDIKIGDDEPSVKEFSLQPLG